MSNRDLHSQDIQIQIKKGLRGNLEDLATVRLSIEGEPLYATDTYQLFISDGDRIRAVQTLDMTVCLDNEVVCLNNEIVHKF